MIATTTTTTTKFRKSLQFQMDPTHSTFRFTFISGEPFSLVSLLLFLSLPYIVFKSYSKNIWSIHKVWLHIILRFWFGKWEICLFLWIALKKYIQVSSFWNAVTHRLVSIRKVKKKEKEKEKWNSILNFKHWNMCAMCNKACLPFEWLAGLVGWCVGSGGHWNLLCFSIYGNVGLLVRH